MVSTYYPASPVTDVKKLTSLPASYKFRAFLAVASIILFFLLYTALVVGLGYLLYYALMYDMGRINKITILLKVGSIAGALMLFVFTLKFIFKLKNHKRENRIKLNKHEHPELFTFVDQICKETGAPKPKAIYVDPDVNAYVSYSNMWLSLFLPVKKELTIGLGLVSCLNLTEFKAVVTHEFGHFAQSSMKIGSYIISANTIIHDMIFSRDKWDDLLDQWRGSDIRLSFAAWVITPIIWIIRQLLNLFYQFLNLMYSSLSREMEFNADKVAVSTTGSEAIVSSLWKLDGGSQHWNDTIGHAYTASQKNILVDNLYLHNNLAIERNEKTQQEVLQKLPEDDRGGKLYFSVSENSKAGMYSSHPPNDLREKNAKTPFISNEEDERSPWILFGEKEKLQKEMTTLVYQQYLSKKNEDAVTPETFEHFIAEESKGKDLLASYDNTFENRFLNIPDEQEMKNAALRNKDATIKDVIALKEELKTLMKPVRAIENLMLKAQEIANGTTKQKGFAFKGTTYNKKSLQDGYTKLLADREKHFEEDFKAWDIALYGIHMALAKKTGDHEDLQDLYLQHKAIASIYRSLVATQKTIYADVNQIQAKSEVTQIQVNALGRNVSQKIYALNEEIAKLDEIDFVELPNIDNVQELKEAIVDSGEFKEYPTSMFNGEVFGQAMGVIETAISHCQRVEQKSIAAILSLQNKVVAETN